MALLPSEMFGPPERWEGSGHSIRTFALAFSLAIPAVAGADAASCQFIGNFAAAIAGVGCH
jgi:hypothetical protein